MPQRTKRSRFRVPRIAATAGVVLAITLVALLLFRTGGDYRVTAVFDNAGQLVEGNEVRVAGTPVGSVERIGLTDDGRAEVELTLDEAAAPLHEGTRARIRVASLSGIANRYVSLHPGPNSNREVADGGEIGADRTQSPVDLDQLFALLDDRTRKGLRQVIHGFATQYRGKGRTAGEALRYLDPALSRTSALLDELMRDRAAFERFVTSNAELVEAIAARRSDLSGLISNARTTATAIADENAALDRALGLLPPTLRRANTTLVNLRATLDDLDPFVTAARPATRDLDVLFARLRPLVADARPAIRDVRLLVRRPGRGNDLIELTSRMPRLAELSGTVFPRAERTLQRSLPVLEYARPYAPDLVGWLQKFSHAAANYDANGHLARVQPLFNQFSYTENPLGPLLNVDPAASRLDGLETRQDRRCPGGAVQPSPDGSTPWQPSPDHGCDPDDSPAGGP